MILFVRIIVCFGSERELVPSREGTRNFSDDSQTRLPPYEYAESRNAGHILFMRNASSPVTNPVAVEDDHDARPRPSSWWKQIRETQERVSTHLRGAYAHRGFSFQHAQISDGRACSHCIL
ncbi:hypothetical protein CDAR_31621 [Caerostris darwini]|uniref:Uncharacterized protein n=1 Tax=Caerostris darwini TaxID=1538125 RepID=A0AAV4NW73_9ARAC|nr:hypothetical protein CDAR_31621 [Caerostris darwini]